eukprot:6197762-Pleurochrysis_carterae.AAC.2
MIDEICEDYVGVAMQPHSYGPVAMLHRQGKSAESRRLGNCFTETRGPEYNFNPTWPRYTGLARELPCHPTHRKGPVQPSAAEPGRLHSTANSGRTTDHTF